MRRKLRKFLRQLEKPRRFESVLLLPCAGVTLWLAGRVIGTKLFLVYLYGWARVRQQHLEILSMPKGRPWPVSNGDLIYEQHFLHYLISVPCWLVLFFITYGLLRLALPKREPAAA